VSADQLAAARAYIEAKYPPDNLQASGQLADILGGLELYGLGRDEIDGQFGRIDAVTVADANRVLKRYYDGTMPVLVLIGRAQQIREQVRGYTDNIIEVSITEPGFLWQTQIDGPSNS
jgi:zinc protease